MSLLKRTRSGWGQTNGSALRPVQPRKAARALFCRIVRCGCYRGGGACAAACGRRNSRLRAGMTAVGGPRTGRRSTRRRAGAPVDLQPRPQGEQGHQRHGYPQRPRQASDQRGPEGKRHPQLLQPDQALPIPPLLPLVEPRRRRPPPPAAQVLRNTPKATRTAV
ncbi:uncharacterized protein Tco025E_10107 [Trypanosoma conorhini]|uniref:Uncharacterized protein n=1 Tax=Trypanosoma conorhini TaxID=83891 RepID=A0A3R7JQG4_9TRYP|nr:uncharacterized protein Tco025E_10107 [Trypanosoma conorhini]RNE95236.1 hypothetical protein Tco025E_10107 [Trypanosoma conorhini]